jgi:uncharacterized protein (TIGR03067 family)
MCSQIAFCRRRAGALTVAVVLFGLVGCQTWVAEEGLTLPNSKYLAQAPEQLPAKPQFPPVPEKAMPADARSWPERYNAEARKSVAKHNDPYVAELLDLIAQTKSVDAFMVTVKLLAEESPEARQVIPTVIRNAERLGIYGRFAIDNEVRGATVAKQVTELIAQISDSRKIGTTTSDPPAPTKADANNAEQKRFQGSWTMIGCVEGGVDLLSKDDPKSKLLPEVKLVFDNGRCTFSQGYGVQRFTVTLDSNAIDMLCDPPGANPDIKAIYRFVEDELFICHPSNFKGLRPKDFNAEAGSNQRVFRLKRSSSGETGARDDGTKGKQTAKLSDYEKLQGAWTLSPDTASSKHRFIFVGDQMVAQVDGKELFRRKLKLDPDNKVIEGYGPYVLDGDVLTITMLPPPMVLKRERILDSPCPEKKNDEPMPAARSGPLPLRGAIGPDSNELPSELQRLKIFGKDGVRNGIVIVDEKPAAKKEFSDHDKFQGTWRLVHYTYRDVNVAGAELEKLVKLTLTVRGDEMRFHAQSGPIAADGMRPRFKLHPEHALKQIDLMDSAGKVVHGIYKFQGGKLWMCYCPHCGPRPTAFAVTPAGSPLVGSPLVYVFERIEDPPSKPDGKKAISPGEVDQPGNQSNKQKVIERALSMADSAFDPEDPFKDILKTVREAPPGNSTPGKGVQPTTSTDLAKLQGAWELVSVSGAKGTVKGKDCEPSALVFLGNRCLFVSKNAKVDKEDKGLLVVLRDKQNPKEIDFSGEDGSGVLGIYRLKGDTLTICLNWTKGVRPASFDASQENVDVRVYKRSQRKILEGKHTSDVRSLAFISDGKLLASASNDKTIHLWDAVGGKYIATLKGHTGGVAAVAFSPDSKTLVSASEDWTVRLWDVASGKNTGTLKGHEGWVNGVAFSPDGKTVATGANDRTVRLWDVVSGKNTAVLEGHSEWVFAVAFNPDGKTLASGSQDTTARLWDVASGKSMRTLGHPAYVESVAFSPDGKTVATGSRDDGGIITLWDAATGRRKTTLTGHINYVFGLAFSRDGKMLASGTGTGGDADGEVKLWDVASGKNIVTLNTNTPYVWCVALRPDGMVVASGSQAGIIQLWDVPRAEKAAHPKKKVSDDERIQGMWRIVQVEVMSAE